MSERFLPAGPPGGEAFRAIFDNVTEGVLVLVRGEKRYFNRRVAEFTGVSFEDFAAAPFLHFVHPDDRDEARRRVVAAEATGEPVVDFELRTIPAPGDTRTIVTNAVRIDWQGEPAVLVLAADVTAQRRTETALDASERRFAAFMEHMPASAFIKDETGRVLFANRHFVELMGATSLNGKTNTDLFAPDEAGRLAADDRRVFDAGPACFSEELPDGRGRRRNFETHKFPIPLDDGRRLLGGMAFDVTERKALEADLNQARKMEAVGTLAGGVAHDFNNILAGLQGALTLLETGRLLPGETTAVLREMKSLVRRGSGLASQLVGFSRRGKYNVQPHDLAAVAAEVSAILERSRRDVTFERGFPDGLLAVLMDRPQLEQLLLNLLLNAVQAMPAGGRLRLRAENALLAREQAEPLGLKPGPYVRLVVADTGVGMTAAVLARAFEPFFTTKGGGQGTGIGLAAVYGIVKHHGGHIRAQSEPGRGCEFTLHLPATHEGVRAEAASARPGPGTGSKVLVVDDEEIVLRITARMLELLGYTVLTATSGAQAVEILRTRPEDIGLVVLDMVMPNLDGPATFARLRELAPNVKVLIASGYAVDSQAAALLQAGCFGFLQKPFDLDTLAAALGLRR